MPTFVSDCVSSRLFSAGPIYMRLDTRRDGLHAFPIARSWREVARGVDAVFSFSDKMYFIKVGLGVKSCSHV